MRIRNSRKTRLVWTVAFVALGATPVALGQTAGQMLFVKGDVQIVATDGVRRPARQGEMIQPGERVVTGPGAMGQVKLADGGFVGVRPDSGVHFEPRNGSAPRSMALTAGKVRVLNVDGGKGVSPMVVKTPHGELRMQEADALAGILPVAPGEDGTVRTVMKLNRGTGTAVDKAGTPLEMAGGEAVSVRPGQATPQKVAALAVPGLISPNALAVAGGDGSGAPMPAATGAGGGALTRNTLPQLPIPKAEPVNRRVTTPSGGIERLTGVSRIGTIASSSPPPTRVVDPNVFTAVATGRLPQVAFTKDSSSGLNDAVRGIVAAGTGIRTTPTLVSQPTITTIGGTKIVTPTRTGSLTGTLTGTRTPTTTTTIKTGTFALSP